MRGIPATKLLLFLLLLLLDPVFAGRADVLGDDEVVFTGTVSSVVTSGDGVGTVFIRLQNFDQRVVVDLDAEILDEEGEEIFMEDLAVDDEVEVRGKFSASGILASQIRLLRESKKEFELNGLIEETVRPGSDTYISLHGIRVQVLAETKIKQDRAGLLALDLKVGMKVSVEGTISKTTWTATEIKVGSENGTTKENKITFLGKVTEVSAEKIKVAVTGTASDVTPVLINDNTFGDLDLAKGLLVMVRGFLNADLSVTAREIRVVKALEIKPRERKIKIGESNTLTVDLRETAAADVQVTLKSTETSVVTLSSSSVTIPKGARTADFTAKGVDLGFAEITAEAFGEKATAEVSVGELSGTLQGIYDEDRLFFHPQAIMMGPYASRDVEIRREITARRSDKVYLEFLTKKGIVAVQLGAGDFTPRYHYRDDTRIDPDSKITIRSTGVAGTDSVKSHVGLFGLNFELIVTVTDKGADAQKLGIYFDPSEIKMGIQSKNLLLKLDQELSKTVTVALKSSGDAVSVASSVTIPAGWITYTVTVTGKSEGKAEVEARLPEANGGDKATLKVEVKKQ